MTIAESTPTLPPNDSPLPAARAVELTKLYGKGDAVVRAVDGPRVALDRTPRTIPRSTCR